MDINITNYLNIQEQIQRKKGYLPYYVTQNTSSPVLTDFDTFPYKRWWRGEPGNPNPIVIEREAGWRPRQDACYKKLPNMHRPPLLADLCFETPCSTVFPCRPTQLFSNLGSQATNIASNNECINENQ